MDTENRLTAVRGDGLGGLGEKSEGIKQRKKERLKDTDNSLVIARGKGVWGREEGVKEGKWR